MQARRQAMILSARAKSVQRDARAKEVRRKLLLKPAVAKERIEQLKAMGQIRLHDLFDDEEVHQVANDLNLKFRVRIFSPAVTLGLFVSQVVSREDSASTVVADFNRERKEQGLPPVSGDASAYCKARARLPVELVDHLSDCVNQIAHDKTPQQWKWKGLDAYLVDGLVVRAPDTEANQEEYPQPSSQEEGLGFPQVRMIVTTSLATGTVLHYNKGKVEGKKTGEVALFREKHADFSAGDVVVADCNFESFHDAALLNRRGVHLVCCINASRKSPFKGVCRTIEDEFVELKKPSFDNSRFTREEWEALPETVTYRVIRFRTRGRRSQVTIVTTLLDQDRYSAEEIAELYGLRWDVELDIRSFKTTMGMFELRCLTPEGLDREIAVGVLAYNLVRVLMCDTAAVLDMHPREISFSAARDAWQTYRNQLETTEDLMWIILSAGCRLVRNRPGREEPRAIKRRKSKYSSLTEPRPSHRSRQPSPAKQEPPGKPAQKA
jgi:putative transposase